MFAGEAWTFADPLRLPIHEAKGWSRDADERRIDDVTAEYEASYVRRQPPAVCMQADASKTLPPSVANKKLLYRVRCGGSNTPRNRIDSASS
jgi:hypothetical protein